MVANRRTDSVTLAFSDDAGNEVGFFVDVDERQCFQLLYLQVVGTLPHCHLLSQKGRETRDSDLAFYTVSTR